jgi:hypothetical protein
VRAPRGTLLGVGVAALLVVVLLLVFGRVVPTYDALYAIAWGRELAHGETPQYFAPFTPAAHPGMNLLGALTRPLAPGGAILAFELFGLASLVALALGLFRFGEAVGGRWVGLAGALILLTRPETLGFGLGAAVDAPTAALVVWAAVLEARRPRRGTAVLVLLALAGLLRPEPWLLAGAYALWCILGLRPRSLAGAARLLALAAVGPAVWLLADWVVTGDPLSRFHTLAPAVGERTIGESSTTGLSAVPHVLSHDLGGWLGPVVLVLAAAGCVAALVLERRRTAPAFAAVVLLLLSFAASGATRAPLEQRYLFPAVALLCGFAAIALVLAPQRLAPARARVLIGLGVLALLAGFALREAGRLRDTRDRLATETRYSRGLERIAADGRETILRAPRVYAGNSGIMPLLAVRTGRRPERFIPIPTPGTGLGPGDAAIIPVTAGAARFLTHSAGRPLQPQGSRVVARTRDWLLVTR